MEKYPDQNNAQSQPPPYYPTQPNPDPSFVNPGTMPISSQPVVTIIHTANVGSESTRMQCPHCQAQISTRVKYAPGNMAHIAALVLCLIGCWPCCLIPYCAEGCQDADHECPNCNHFIAHYKR